MPLPPTRAAARVVLATAAVGAGVIHLAVAPHHLEEYLPLGVGFVAAGVLQIGLAGLIAVRDSSRLMRLLGVLSVAFIGVYVLSRTAGLPLGPEAFEPEPLGTVDLLCCALEVPVAMGALLLARRPGALRRPMSMRIGAVALGSLVLVGSATGVALAAPAHDASHEHVMEHADEHVDTAVQGHGHEH